ncbi:MAG: hypothetical protein P8106_11245, partial [Gammaproteobacteria bacterium]
MLVDGATGASRTMSFIPGRIISKLFNHGSLRNVGGKVRFSVKNRLSPATLLSVSHVVVDGDDIPLRAINVAVDDASAKPLTAISDETPLDFPLGTLLTFFLDVSPLTAGSHEITVVFTTRPFGELRMAINDPLNTGAAAPGTLPRDAENDYTPEIIAARQAFLRVHSGAKL